MGTGLILAAGFILKGRKSQADRNARYRAPRPGLKLDRASAGPGRAKDRSPLLQKARPPASPAAPIMLGGVLLVLSLWLAAAYLRPSAESAEAETAAVRTASSPPPPAQVGTLAGRLSAAPEPTATEPTATAPNQPPAPAPSPAKQPPAPPSVPVAANAALNQAAVAQAGGSALSQVGLKPIRQAKSPAPAARPSPAATRAPMAGPDQASLPASPAPASSNMVRATAGPPGGTIPAGGRGILSNTRGFTVHLGSFTDRTNAEKFQTKLAAAGEPAAISETTIDGRLWYRVLSGRFETRTAADAHGRNLRRRDLTDGNGTFIIKPINSDN